MKRKIEIKNIENVTYQETKRQIQNELEVIVELDTRVAGLAHEEKEKIYSKIKSLNGVTKINWKY